MNRRWRRRNYFIKKDLQGRYVFSFFLFVALGCLLFALILGYLSSNSLTMTYENYNLRVGSTPLILLKDFIEAHWLFLLTGGIAVVVISIFLTHRVAGPVFRFEKTLQSMISGKLDFTVRLRKRDEAKELAELFNELIRKLSSDIKDIRKQVKALEDYFNRPREDMSPEEVKKIDSALKRIKEVVDSYTVSEDD